MICRYCDKPITGHVGETTAYWRVFGTASQPKYPCHPECKKQGVKDEALACQTLDADCNDCRHFTRLPHDDGDRRFEVFPGRCQKFDKPAQARPNHASLLPCFDHRRTT